MIDVRKKGRLLMMNQQGGGGGGLPDDYQLVSFIKGDGGQYFKTSICPIASDSFTFDFYTGANFAFTIIGASKLNGFYKYSSERSHLSVEACYQQLIIKYGENNLKELGYLSYYETHPIVEVERQDSVLSNFEPFNLPYYILATNCNGNPRGGEYGENLNSNFAWHKFSYLIISDRAHFVAVRRKSDNKPGLFDVLWKSVCPETGNHFHINSGIGEFTYGSDVLE